jgi:hypothetical protein
MATRRVLHLFICGAGPAEHIQDLIALAHDDGCDVYCIATQSAVEHFLDTDALAKLTHHPVRTGYREPGQPPHHHPTPSS